MDTAPADSITMRTVVILTDLPIIPAEYQCSAARCVTAYLWCCCEFHASTCTSISSICVQCK